MKGHSIHRSAAIALALFVLLAAFALGAHVGAQETSADSEQVPAAILGTAFTYQGRLQQSDLPATGNFDFQFTLYDAVTGGTQVGAVQQMLSVPVTDGLFDVELDFGTVFNGLERYLSVAVRPAGAGSFTELVPRQKVTATPYANYAAQTSWFGITDGPPGVWWVIEDQDGGSTFPNDVFDTFALVGDGITIETEVFDGGAVISGIPQHQIGGWQQLNSDGPWDASEAYCRRYDEWIEFRGRLTGVDSPGNSPSYNMLPTDCQPINARRTGVPCLGSPSSAEMCLLSISGPNINIFKNIAVTQVRLEGQRIWIGD